MVINLQEEQTMLVNNIIVKLHATSQLIDWGHLAAHALLPNERQNYAE